MHIGLHSHIGPSQRKTIIFDTVREDTVSIIFIAALVSLTEIEAGWNRYLISLAKQDEALLSTTAVSLNKEQMAKVLQEAGCGELVQNNRLCDGSFGTHTKQKHTQRMRNSRMNTVVQLRYYANIDSMYHLIRYIRDKTPEGLPVARMLPPPSSPKSDLKVQISQFVPGNMGSTVITGLSPEEKLSVVKQMARAFAALWDLPVPGAGELIGDAIVSPQGTVSVGPERRYGLGGPFSSVTSYLQAWIKSRVDKLQNQQCIDEYKEKSTSAEFSDSLNRRSTTFPSRSRMSCSHWCIRTLVRIT